MALAEEQTLEQLVRLARELTSVVMVEGVAVATMEAPLGLEGLEGHLVVEVVVEEAEHRPVVLAEREQEAKLS